jgi:hypothetical protein
MKPGYSRIVMALLLDTNRYAVALLCRESGN